MKLTAKAYAITTALAVFIGLPLLLYALGDTPRRSLMKESLSLLTLLAFTMMLGQFFLARSNAVLLSLFKTSEIQKVHKYIAYTAVGAILVHPFLIVLPRYFEAGVKPLDAFLTMLTAFSSLGILLGIAAWLLLVVLAVTAYLRVSLSKRFKNRYRGWRYLHGGLSVIFTVLGVWHAIELGRHTDFALSAFFVTLVLIGFALLAKLYWGAQPKKQPTDSTAEGAST